jgi:protein SCO1
VISIDPRDRPADVAVAKTKYLAAYHHPAGDGGWHFLTGRQPEVEAVSDIVGFPYRYEPALDQYIHPAGFVVAAPDGSISRYILGVDAQPAELQSALTDAAQGKAVGLLTRLLLLCHGDTPQLGRYSVIIEGAFVSANLIAMIGGIAAFVAIWRRRLG